MQRKLYKSAEMNALCNQNEIQYWSSY